MTREGSKESQSNAPFEEIRQAQKAVLIIHHSSFPAPPSLRFPSDYRSRGSLWDAMRSTPLIPGRISTIFDVVRQRNVKGRNY